ncbi:copper amine oxidase N-terminal domain-containing protein [Brevibacillus migulae]|uniref:copper amine oxidase N-terminal domain-containing protein n=1 Tax=Brevibacillus migulae TaxID=1644114 RepID=UPI00106E3463|nr:copper amine oxidase N-terminal domain-containing protein [Brevibacillus migulae]
MKYRKSVTGCLAAAVCFIGMVFGRTEVEAATTASLSIVANGVKVNVPADQLPFIQKGRTLVPVRSLFTELGAEVSWDAKNRVVLAQKEGISLRLPIGAAEAYVNNRPVSLEQPAQMVKGRTFVPLRFVSEALGAKVFWDNHQHTVTIIDDLASVEIPRQEKWPEAWKQGMREQTPAGHAELAMLWAHGVKVQTGPFLAPGLEKQLSQAESMHVQKVWLTYVNDFSVGDAHYISRNVTIQEQDGTIRDQGVDTVEVKLVPDVGYLVTGYAQHRNTVEEPSNGAEFWFVSGLSAKREELSLAALPILSNNQRTGRNCFPLQVLERVGEVEKVADSSYVLKVAGQALTEPFPVQVIDNQPYVDVEILVNALNGRQMALPDASGTAGYRAEWIAKSHQLIIENTGYTRIS